MTAGGAGRLCRWGARAGFVLILAVPAALGGPAPRPVAAQTCVLLCPRDSPRASSPSASPSPQPPELLGIQLPPCLLCVSPPLPLALCGVTTDCRARPPAPVASPEPSPPSGQSSGPAAANPVPVGGSPAGPVTTPAVAGSQTVRTPPSGAQAAGGSGLLQLPVPQIAQLSPVSGLALGGALELWPLFLALNLIALTMLVVVLRRTWSGAAAG